MANKQELSAFLHSAGVMRRTQAMLGQLGGELEQGKELRLPNGTALGVWSMARPEDDAALPTEFDSQFVQIRLDLAGAASGVRLDGVGDWERRAKCGKLRRLLPGCWRQGSECARATANRAPPRPRRWPGSAPSGSQAFAFRRPGHRRCACTAGGSRVRSRRRRGCAPTPSAR